MRTALAIVALLVASAQARAQAPASGIVTVRELVQQARFDEAIDAANALLAQTDLGAAERNAALETLAIAQLANRQQRAAEATLRTLYARDPGHRLDDPDASPPVLSAFARARETRPTPIAVQLAHEPPTVRRREPPALTVRVLEGADAVAEVRLIYRQAGEGESRVMMTRQPDGSYVARIPVVGDATRANDIAYHLVALAPSLTAIGSIGSEAEPLQLRIPADTGTVASSANPRGQDPAPATSGGSVVEEWWFWTVIVLAVGGGVTAAILLGPAQDTPEGTLGSARLMQLAF